MKLYFECYSGISGDMTVGALLSLGVDAEKLREALKTIPVTGFKIEIKNVLKSGLNVCDFNVILKEDNHDHDMDYLKGNKHLHHNHHHRNLKQINEIIDNTHISLNAKNIAKKIFDILAEAESNVHGVKKEEVHFHEVGAVDSIVDIIAISFCIDELNIKDIIVSPLYEGKGFIMCQHGQIPIPVPATLNIISKYNLPLHILDVEGELVTPTGAATIAALKTEEKLPEKYQIIKVGMGNGKREYKTPGILRVMIIKEEK